MATALPKSGRWASSSRGRKIVIVLLSVAVVLVLVLVLAAWIATLVLRPSYPTPQAITERMKAQTQLTGGAKVYATHCAYCHDRGFGPSIAGRSLPSEAVASFVRMGPAGMPAFPPTQVSDADIKAVADYVNGLPLKTGEDK